MSAHFLHLPQDRLRPLFARLAAAVAPGGTLLLVGHHPDDVHTAMRRPDLDAFFTAEEVAATLDSDPWSVEVAEARSRAAVDPEGRGVTIQDAVLRPTTYRGQLSAMIDKTLPDGSVNQAMVGPLSCITPYSSCGIPS